jgi:hypothetical protein
MVCITGKLVFASFKPLKLEVGMLFLNREKSEESISQLDHLPMNDDEYISKYGYPVEPAVVQPGNPNIDNDGFVIVPSHRIGWWDDGEDVDELHTITVKEINNIIDFYDGWVDVEIEDEFDEEDNIIVVKVDGLCILSYAEEYEDDGNEDYLIDEDEYEPPTSNDEWEQNNITNQKDIRNDED